MQPDMIISQWFISIHPFRIICGKNGRMKTQKVNRRTIHVRLIIRQIKINWVQLKSVLHFLHTLVQPICIHPICILSPLSTEIKRTRFVWIWMQEYGQKDELNFLCFCYYGHRFVGSVAGVDVSGKFKSFHIKSVQYT